MTKGKVKEEVLKMDGLGRIPVPNLNLENMTISIPDVTLITKFLPSVAKQNGSEDSSNKIVDHTIILLDNLLIHLLIYLLTTRGLKLI